MPLGYSYLVLGSGKQGLAAAYDILLRGQAIRLTLADTSLPAAQAAVHRLHKLLGSKLKKSGIQLSSRGLDAKNPRNLAQVMAGHQAVLSAIPYYLNPAVAAAAIAAGLHYCDLGGYMESTRLILKLNERAKKAGVTVIPDCGVAPGLCNSLAVCGMERLDKPEEVHIYCGGLPQRPRPPLDYKIVFNLEGVLGNYFGESYVLKNGRVALIPSFSGKEMLSFGRPLGTLEARTTGGATSTAPWTFRGILNAYDYKTLRYPGHYEKIETLKQLGLLETTPVRVNGYRIAPREVFVATAGPKLAFPKDRDLLVMRVVVQGRRDGRKMQAVYDLLDYGDPRTGFTAMQRTTGFPAAIVLALLARGGVPETGVVPVEKAVDGRSMLEAVRSRGIQVKETIRRWKS
jgi:lysine 6-dehydrogenase